MKILLDTDTCIELIRRRAPGVLRRLKRYAPGDVVISSITLAELAFGVSKSAQPDKNRAALDEFASAFVVAPFDEPAANCYGPVRAALQQSGNAIGSLDMLIASHALSLEVVLVTHNVREFSRVRGLPVVDWVAES
jgi:tRNA(fMet)-specific endonuclease VapC